MSKILTKVEEEAPGCLAGIENERRRQEKNEKQAEIDACLPSSRLREDTEYVEELNNLVVRLNVRSHHLVDKLTRIVELISPLNDSPILDAIKVIAFENLPLPSDPIATAEGEMLQEIDKLLMDAGVWVDNRLDSIRRLIGFYTALKSIMREEANDV
ncbi:MAG: hypothetical protein ACTSW7_00805 [Candidatus Thorarchaeota archaeon]|nr:hypothetical protein [Thermoplasmatales archaeon]